MLINTHQKPSQCMNIRLFKFFIPTYVSKRFHNEGMQIYEYAR